MQFPVMIPVIRTIGQIESQMADFTPSIRERRVAVFPANPEAAWRDSYSFNKTLNSLLSS